MTVTTISKDLSRHSYGFYFTQSGDELHVTSTGSLTSTQNVAIFSSFEHSFLLLEGDVRSEVTTAIAVSGNFANVQILGDAVVSSAGLATHESCVAERGDFASLFVQGAINTATGGAVTMQGARCQLWNTGTITGASFAVHLNSQAALLTNDGTITATAGSNIYGAGAVVLNYSDDSLINHGTIAAEGLGVAGLVAWDNRVDGGVGSGLPGVIENHGTISSAGGFGVMLIALVNWESEFSLINSGVISGLSGAVWGNVYADTIINSGTMTGDVFLHEGDDIYDGLGGTVQGRILGGAGDDLYRISDSAAQIVELAGEGRDRIEATVSFDMTTTLHVEKLILLGFDPLNATGNVEANFIIGNAGANVLAGAAGYDRLVAMRGNDLVDGGTGEDQLFGGAGRDTLLGGEGDDRLTGGGGADLLTGGAGADVFLFIAGGNSGIGAKADVISDFVSGLDRINFAAIDADPLADGDQALVFIGAAAFGGVAGQVRYAGGVVEVDLDGISGADMQIILTGAPLLVANDLSL
jgi:Ca2+-binding RTX toxin-like protein